MFDYAQIRQFNNFIIEKSVKLPVNIKIIPNLGATKIPFLASIFIGWGLNFAVILDNDKEGKKVSKNLTENLDIDQSAIHYVSERDKFAIEDLFSKEDFKVYIGKEIEDNSLSNSQLLKKLKIDKVLLAKKFFERTQSEKNIKIDSYTLDNFKVLFLKMKEYFKY